MLDGGASLVDVADQHFNLYLRYRTNLLNYICDRAPKRSSRTECIVIIGATEIGKSHWAETRFPGAYWKPAGNWWPTYYGEEVIVFDEFAGNCLQFSQLCRVLDKYPLIIEIKNSHVQFNSKLVIITSNDPVRNWYHNITETRWLALERRFNYVHVSDCVLPQSLDLPALDELFAEHCDYQMP